MHKRMKWYVNEVLRFNRALNLTGIRDAKTFDHQLIRPAMALAEHCQAGECILDVGSGMGVPGIPMLIAKPDLTAVLVDRRKKRVEFMRHVVRHLKLDAQLFADDIRHIDVQDIDVCVARAVTRAHDLLQMVAPMMSPTGRALLHVPSDSEAVALHNWKFKESLIIPMQDQQQRIDCYQYTFQPTEVSRET